MTSSNFNWNLTLWMLVFWIGGLTAAYCRLPVPAMVLTGFVAGVAMAVVASGYERRVSFDPDDARGRRGPPV